MKGIRIRIRIRRLWLQRKRKRTKRNLKNKSQAVGQKMTSLAVLLPIMMMIKSLKMKRNRMINQMEKMKRRKPSLTTGEMTRRIKKTRKMTRMKKKKMKRKRMTKTKKVRKAKRKNELKCLHQISYIYTYIDTPSLL